MERTALWVKLLLRLGVATVAVITTAVVIKKRNLEQLKKIKNDVKKAAPYAVATAVAVGCNVLESLVSGDDNRERGIFLTIDSSNESNLTEMDAVTYLPRYKVEMQALKTGEWYTQTRTDNIASAYSVGKTSSWGRAYKIIDTETGDILEEEVKR